MRYVYSDITGRKTQTRSYALTADLENDVLALSNNDITRVEYTYDTLGRLYETKTIKRDGSTLGTAEVTTYTYDTVGNRDTTALANGVTATHTYDNCNRLTNISNSSSLSSFGYTLYPNGMRHTVAETLKTSSGTSETHNITYTYDNLNRLTGESATCSSPSGSYSEDYTYDVVGNRTYREVTANGTNLTTDYHYDSGTDRQTDRLTREINTGPVACVPTEKERYYVYANSNGGGLTYKTSGGVSIGKVKAFMLGLPNELAGYILVMLLICVPVSFFAPVLVRIIRCREQKGLSLYHRCLCVLLAYVMLISPVGLESVAQASSQYSQISTADWASYKYIEYTYDDNGSMTSKITKVTSTQTETERVIYEYNLQNRLAKVSLSTNGGTTWSSITEYKYDSQGNRVSKTVDSVTTSYLVDSYNHTGYSQVFVETTGSDKTCYVVGDDVLAQAKNTDTPKYMLHDGHGSTRQLVNSAGSSVLESYSYDAYGVMLGGNPGGEANPSSAQTNMLYTGQQWDNSAQMYYLRARYYDTLNGRFNQMDTFAGNNRDPQSLHKYLYCHANPINGVDPSGNEFDLGSMMTAISIMSVMSGVVGGVSGAVRGYADYGNWWGGVLGFGSGFASSSVGTFTSLVLSQYFGLSRVGRFMAFGMGSAVGTFIDTLLYKGSSQAFTADAGCHYLASLLVGGSIGLWVGYSADDMVETIANNLKSIRPVWEVLGQLQRGQGVFAMSEKLRAKVLMGAICQGAPKTSHLRRI